MLRIIHIVENLDKGAVENWLVNVFLESRKSRPEWDWTFYCILGKKGRLDEKVLASGGNIIYSPYWLSDKVKFIKYLRRTLRSKRYDIIHSHHDYLSGFYLLATFGISFKKRILHIHNTDKMLPVGNAFLQKMLLPIFRRLALFFSDTIVGISNNSLAEFVGSAKLKNKEARVLYYGIDLLPFGRPIDKEWLGKELSIPKQSKILLYIGRLTKLKNPEFVIDILYQLLKKRQDVYAVIVGKGELEEAVVRKAMAYGIIDNVKMLGWRDDGAALMQASDVFVFPRIEFPKEGLGLVVVEAQAAGLPMVVSRGIVEDAIEIRELAHILPLENNAADWASSIDEILNGGRAINDRNAYQFMQQSKFSLANCALNLINLYTK